MPVFSLSKGRSLTVPAVIALSVSLSGCAGGGNMLDMASLTGKQQPPPTAETEAQPQTELQRATAYWGKQYQAEPQNAQAAVNYVRNLKALGAKQQALGVIQQAHNTNPQNKAIASEYGRLALDMDQVPVAEKLLAMADDPVAPDWKVISARGTVLAKQGRYREAIQQFERAKQLAPNQPSITNNLALAHAMNGQADKAEPLLREAAADANADPKVTQNLSLVLGLQGKHDDAKSVIVRSMPSEDLADDASFVREMVGTKAPAAVASTGRANPPATAQISTSSTSKTKSKAKPAAPPQEDASVLVQRLADGYANTPADAPIELTPKRQ